MLQIYQLSQQKTRKELIKENPIAFKAFENGHQAFLLF